MNSSGREVVALGLWPFFATSWSLPLTPEWEVISPAVMERSLARYLQALRNLATRSQNKIEPAVMRSAYDWIDGRLIAQGRVNLISRPKKLTLTQDVTLLLQTLFTVDYMATRRHTCDILYTSLSVNLAVDCAGRVSEFLMEGGPRCEGKCLC